MSAQRGREASDSAAWRRRGKALARVLEAVENHKVDWRESRHIRQAQEEVGSLPRPEIELYLGVEIAAGWLAHLIREIALDKNATLHQMQFIIGAARGMIENGAFALAAQKIIGSREVDSKTKWFKDKLHARKESQKKQTTLASRKRRERKELLDELVPALAAELRAIPGKSKFTHESIARGILESVNSKLLAAGMKGVGVDAIADRLRKKPTAER
jgi:hypothetical protein